MEHTHLVISFRKRSFLEIALLGGLDTCCKNALFISWASYALLDSNMFKFFIKKKVDCHISRDVSFPISVFYWERFFLKQSSLFPSPYSSSGGGAELPHWRSGRGPRHLQLSFCTSLLFRVCVQRARVLTRLSQSSELRLVALAPGRPTFVGHSLWLQ